MTYFQDLTPYRYCGEEKGALNIGWLSVERPFPTGETPPGLADALAICAQRPENLCRGFHLCDICPAPDSWDGQTAYNLGGRSLELGNGEIWLTSPEGVEYRAPTLIAHYVAAHHYLPPATFIEAAMMSASTAFVVYGDLFATIRTLSLRQQYKVCLSVFEAASRHKDRPLTPNALEILQEAEAALDTPQDTPSRKNAIEKLESIAPDHEKEAELFFLFFCAKWFLLYSSAPPDNQELAVHRVALALEGGFDAGLSVEALEAYVEAVQ